MKRTAAHVGMAVWVGTTARPESLMQGVIVTLDCGDNGYRVGVAVLQRDGREWRYGMWPLHSVHSVGEGEAMRARARAKDVADKALDAEARAELEWMREAVAELEMRTGYRIELAPNFRTREHRAVLSKDGLAAVLGAVRRAEPRS